MSDVTLFGVSLRLEVSTVVSVLLSNSFRLPMIADASISRYNVCVMRTLLFGTNRVKARTMFEDVLFSALFSMRRTGFVFSRNAQLDIRGTVPLHHRACNNEITAVLIALSPRD